jgi:Cu/Ag efflux protein CusF
MERTLAVALALFFVLSVVGPTGNAIAITKAKSKEVTGQIVSVNPDAKLLTVKTKKGEMTFNVDEKTKIKMGKEEKNISDLKVGKKIKVYYTHVDGKDLAETIIINTVTKRK